MITVEEFKKALELLKEDPYNEEANQVLLDYGVQEGFLKYEVYRIG